MRLFVILILIIIGFEYYCAENNIPTSVYAIEAPRKQGALTPFPNDDSTRKIIQRNRLQHEGLALAQQGRHDEALVKYQASLDPALLNVEEDKYGGLWGIMKIYQRQGRFEEALEKMQWFLKVNPQKDSYIIKHLELLALIKARDTKNNKSIYDHINYLKTKYAKYFPPNGYMVGFSDSLFDDFIYLYDYMHDYDSGIAFMDEIIKYHANHKDPNHRSAHKKDVAEYTRVKQAWEFDKKTGQHGHLREVIRTSNIISW